MWNDIVDLQDFYADGLGQTARRMIRAHLRALWPNLSGLRLLGLGYATPYLGVFRGEAERVLAVMPAPMGVSPWPAHGDRLVALADETELPLADSSIDRVLLVHALESTEHVRAMMREIWRVLTDGGRLLVVVPNRRGIWARLDRTPMGMGRPYSSAQLVRLLRESLFLPVRESSALYLPPLQSRTVRRSAPLLENAGRRWFPTFGGVVMLEAVKQIYAAPRAGAKRSVSRVYAPLPQGFRRG